MWEIWFSPPWERSPWNSRWVDKYKGFSTSWVQVLSFQKRSTDLKEVTTILQFLMKCLWNTLVTEIQHRISLFKHVFTPAFVAAALQGLSQPLHLTPPLLLCRVSILWNWCWGFVPPLQRYTKRSMMWSWVELKVMLVLHECYPHQCSHTGNFMETYKPNKTKQYTSVEYFSATVYILQNSIFNLT